MPFIGQQPTTGAFLELDSLTASATADYTLQLNGANYYPESVNNLLVSINGVIQGSSTMSLSGSTLTVGATLSSSDVIDFVRVFGNVGTISTPTDGSVTTNKIGNNAVDLTTKVTGTLPVANGGTGVTSNAGIILQTVVHQEDGATTFTASGTSPRLLLASNAADSTSHLSLSITPKFSSSKILLSTNVFFEGDQSVHSYGWSFYRDSTKLAAADVGNRPGVIAMTKVGFPGTDQASTPDAATYMYYDSPNTTSAITYAVAFQHTTSGAAISLNKTDTDDNTTGFERGISILIAQEIGA